MSSDEPESDVVETSEPGPQEPRTEAPGGRERTSIPPADFGTLVTMLSTQAMVGLGYIPHPATGKPTPNLELARHFIDLLGVIDKKTMGNLEVEEHKFLDSTLHDLRMAFVQMLRGGTPSEG